jgi:plasmid stability protein
MIACNHLCMAAASTSLTVRNLSPETKARLAARARRRGRSLEAEVREILDTVAETPDPAGPPFPDWLIAMVEPGEDIGPLIDEHRRPHPPIDL